MTAVECSTKSGPYSRQVSAGVFASDPLTGRNISVGLRTACTSEFTDARTATRRSAARTIRTANGARRSATSARPVKRHAAAPALSGVEGRCARRRRVRARGRVRGIVADVITEVRLYYRRSLTFYHSIAKP